MAQPRILIAASEPLAVQDLRRELSELGYEVLAETPAAGSAARLAAELRPDLVLMDLSLEGERVGITAAQIIRDRFDLPLVFLAASSAAETLDRAEKSEPFGYILKPVEKRELQIVIEFALYKHRAETLLRRGREEQAAILRTTLDGYWLVDDQGRILDVNEVCCQMHGYRREEMLGKHLTDFEADESAAEIAAVVDRVQQAGSARFERRHRRKDGHLIDVEVSTTSLPGESGHFSAFLRDISERKGAENEARILAQRLTLATDAASIGIWDWDIRADRWYATPNYFTMLGYEPEAGFTDRERWIERVHPDDRATVAAKIREVLEGSDEPYQYDARVRHADGSYRWISVTGRVAEVDAQGKATRMLGVRVDVTERKRTEAALRENEDRYRDLVNNSEELISTHDLEGNFLSVNESTVRVTGYSRAALLKMNLVELVAPKTRHLFPEYLRTLQTVGEARGIMQVQTASGETRFWEYNATLRTEGVAVPVVRGMGVDITERLLAERALRASHERFELANRATFDIIWDWDLRTHAIWRNDNFRAQFGYSADEQETGFDLSTSLVHPDDLLRVRAGIQAALDAKSEHWAERYRFRRKDGSYATVEDRAIITWDASGHAIRMLGAMQDISERERAEARLRLQSGALEAAANAILITDRLGMIEWANPAFTTFTGYSQAEAIGKRPGDLLRSGSHDRAFYKGMWDAILGGNVWRGEVINRRKDGSLYTEEMTITPLRDPGGELTHFVAVKQDVTQRKVLEQSFRQSQKLEAVGRLAGGVAHDFNNMLGVILGYVEVALDQLDPSQELHGDLLEIQKAAGRSSALTRQLLAFARQEAIAPKVLNLNETVTGMLTMLRRLIGESIEVSWQPAATVWPIEMDPSQIDQIVANLCVNARDAIAGVGTIALATANCAIDAEFCASNVDAVAGDFVRLTVSDTGGGMDKEMLTRIFEPFFTTKGVGEGTGLGLSMVYGAVKQNRGFLMVRSTPGQGTAFEIYLPRHVGQAEPVRNVVAAAPARRGLETILLVEDEPAILRLTTRALEAQGYAVLAASSPNAALVLAREHADDIHLLLTDVVMPEMNGRELAKRLLTLHPRLKCVFMSGYTADVIAKGGVLEEGVHFLQKPFAIADLAATVRRVLDRE